MTNRTGLFVVPEVYRIIPPFSSPFASNVIFPSSIFFHPMLFSTPTSLGLVSNSFPNTSLALASNFVELSNNGAPLCCSIYCSSLVGKAGLKGNAMECAPKIESNVTILHQRPLSRRVLVFLPHLHSHIHSPPRMPQACPLYLSSQLLGEACLSWKLHLGAIDRR